MNNVYVLDRVRERHPDVSKEDAVHAWLHCVKCKPRLNKDPIEYAAIGYDRNGELLELVARSNNRGDWLIKHAQRPPQESIKRELGFERRKS